MFSHYIPHHHRITLTKSKNELKQMLSTLAAPPLPGTKTMTLEVGEEQQES